jgi:Ca-activated chloride channel family protein
MNLTIQLSVATAVAAVIVALAGWRAGDFAALWLTPDQQGRLAYERQDFSAAGEVFEDPTWQGTALYAAGRYPEAADAFGRLPTAQGFYNRGNAFMKAFDYGKAIAAYELAVAEAPDWQEATDNLELARYVLDYIQDTREQSDTGDETELGADDYKFDNTQERGREMTITNESTIELESAEKWMRSVDTETADFLRIRFALEASREAAP